MPQKSRYRISLHLAVEDPDPQIELLDGRYLALTPTGLLGASTIHFEDMTHLAGWLATIVAQLPAAERAQILEHVTEVVAS